MGKLIVSEYLTLDGVMEAPEKWSFPYHGESIRIFKHDELFNSDVLLLGDTTYRIFAGAWPSRSDEYGFAARMNEIPKYVATQQTTLEWNNSHALSGDIAAAVAELKQRYQHNILAVGSATLVQALMQHNLVDEYQLLVAPIVLGTGKRLFQDGMAAELQLVKTQAFDTGMALLAYHSKPLKNKI